LSSEDGFGLGFDRGLCLVFGKSLLERGSRSGGEKRLASGSSNSSSYAIEFSVGREVEGGERRRSG
jgi:hypothetical protein